MTNQLTAKNFFSQAVVKAKFEELMGDRAPQFITSVLQIVANNALLSKADASSIYNAAAMAAALNLPLNDSLGFAYIVPYNNKQKDGTYKVVAQFQIGYKGFIQLAQRSGLYKTISEAPIYEGQLVEMNPLTGFVFDFTKKVNNNVIGYASYFSLINGFEKTLYMTIEEIKSHAGRYSQTFKKGFGQWNDNFDSMARKTALKLLLSKYGPLSISLEKAIKTDQGLLNDDSGENVEYVDNTYVEVNKEDERVKLLIVDATNAGELINSLKGVQLSPDQTDLFNQKMSELNG